MQRLRESRAVRWIAVLLFATVTSACASWERVEGPDVPDRVRVITTSRSPVELTEVRVHGDSILVGLDPQANETRIIPTDSILWLESRQDDPGVPILIAAALIGIVGWFWIGQDDSFPF